MIWASVLALFILALDAITKYLTEQYLPLLNHALPFYPYGGIPIFKDFLGMEFSLVHATNKGAAWGILANYSQLLFLGRLLLIVFLVIYFARAKTLSQQIPLALILAGAIGNVLDYFVYGHVVDMFHFVLWGYNYPVFNVADSAIFMGILLYLILSRRSCEPSTHYTL